MATGNEHIFEPGIYFVTFTNYKWMHLFDKTRSYDLVYNWFDILKNSGNDTLGYVIMPNHVHALIGFKPVKKSVNTIVGNGKRFMAYDIVERLQKASDTKTLKILSDGVTPSDRRKGKLHEVFEPTTDIKLCHSYKFVKQKLDYMHSNPVTKKWSLVKEPADYIHSSAAFYLTGRQGIYVVMDSNDWINENWFNSADRQAEKANPS